MYYKNMKTQKLLSVTFVYSFLQLCTSVLTQKSSILSDTVNCSSTGIINITVDTAHSDDCELSTNLTVCGSLQTASEAALDMAQQDFDCIAILIPSGHHRVTNPVNFGDISVYLVGLRTDVTILCDYEPVSLGKQYTWYFNQSREVVIENVNIANCSYPVRVDTVQRVNIANVSFM